MTHAVDVDFAALAERLRASTVQVIDARGQGAGSGVVWSADGTIATNAHVVRGSHATIAFADGRRERGEVVARDAGRDLAALRVRGTTLVPAERRETPLRAGELVVAVGNPLGLIGAVTTGIVQRASARWVVADVRLAPGNSGGPLADVAGRVVGINSMVAGERALAVPVAQFAELLGQTQRERLGVAVVPIVLPARAGGGHALLISGIEPDSRAERAGLELGDVLLATERGPLAATGDAASALASATTLEIVRGGARRTLAIPGSAASRAA